MLQPLSIMLLKINCMKMQLCVKDFPNNMFVGLIWEGCGAIECITYFITHRCDILCR